MEHTFQIEGMSCGGCVAAVEQALKSVPGVTTVRVDLGAKSALIEFDPSKTAPPALREAIEAAGYEVVA
ncbi:heavy-metal-associated domain-containing protein [Chitinimonas lacunae]|uniref:Heavy-metal-associated domain-containing protein n=1 Tax=Chitinimonas lacunae TaxID=1963018 RepID=A0ABV8MTS7_9NEIS